MKGMSWYKKAGEIAGSAAQKGRELWQNYKVPLVYTGLSALSYGAGAAAERLGLGYSPDNATGLLEAFRLSPHFFLSLAGAETARRLAGESWDRMPWYKKAGVLGAGAVLPLAAYEGWEAVGSTPEGYSILKGIVGEAPVAGDLPRQGFEHAGSLGDVVKAGGAALLAEGAKDLGKKVLRR